MAKEILMQHTPRSSFLRFVAQFFSYLFHPVFLISYMAAYLLFADPQAYLGVDSETKQFTLIRIFATNTFLPLVVVFISKGLGFIDSIKLKTQRERIIPYVACITFFFWTFYVSRQIHDPAPMQSMLLSAFLSAIAALMANIYYKISMHAIGAGGLLGLMSVLLFATASLSAVPLLITAFIAGIICTSRFIVSNHTPFEIYSGFIAGFLLEWISWLLT